MVCGVQVGAVGSPLSRARERVRGVSAEVSELRASARTDIVLMMQRYLPSSLPSPVNGRRGGERPASVTQIAPMTQSQPDTEITETPVETATAAEAVA